MPERRTVRTRHAELTLENIGGALPGTGEIMASVSSCCAILYRHGVVEANGYHVSTGHPYIRWILPAEPPEKGLDLTAGDATAD